MLIGVPLVHDAFVWDEFCLVGDLLRLPFAHNWPLLLEIALEPFDSLVLMDDIDCAVD